MIVLREEAGALAAGLRQLPPPAWAKPTRCTPWTVSDLVGHLITVLSRVPAALARPAPPQATCSAAGYYRADERFSAAANATRVEVAVAQGSGSPGSLIASLTTATGQVAAACAGQPPARVVETRHGDAMLLTDFLRTRVFELAVHGLDLADAAGVEPWLTPAAADVVRALTGGSPADDIRHLTGRAGLPSRLPLG